MEEILVEGPIGRFGYRLTIYPYRQRGQYFDSWEAAISGAYKQIAERKVSKAIDLHLLSQYRKVVIPY